MDAIYKSVFINYADANREDLTIGEFGDILVVTTSRDEAAIQPYVQWKREKGYDVDPWKLFPPGPLSIQPFKMLTMRTMISYMSCW